MSRLPKTHLISEAGGNSIRTACGRTGFVCRGYEPREGSPGEYETAIDERFEATSFPADVSDMPSLPAMMHARVINKRDNWSCQSFVWVDRQGPWGNPFKIGRDGTRETVLSAHEGWLRRTPELVQELYRLHDRALACWCDPQPCHGWLLAFLANGTWEEGFDWLLGKPYWTESRLRSRSVPGAPGWKVGTSLDGNLGDL